MENLFIELVKQINPVQIIIIGLIFFYFYNRLDDKVKETNKEIKESNKEIKEEIKALSIRIDAINARLDSLYRELFRKDAA